MLTEVCQYLRNWFEKTKYFGDFSISEGILTYSDGSALPLIEGQYFRIVGSVLNDGVWKCGENIFVDEEFSGAVWSMAVPTVFLELIEEIESWCTANKDALDSPYQSESFGGYSYSFKSGVAASGESVGATWQSQFASRLNPWRKI